MNGLEEMDLETLWGERQKNAGCSLCCDKDYCAVARGLGPHPAHKARSGVPPVRVGGDTVVKSLVPGRMEGTCRRGPVVQHWRVLKAVAKSKRLGIYLILSYLFLSAVCLHWSQVDKILMDVGGNKKYKLVIYLHHVSLHRLTACTELMVIETF